MYVQTDEIGAELGVAIKNAIAIASGMLIGIGIIIMISLCNKIKRPGAINITCIAFLGVTTAHAYSDPLYYALNRSCETILGIIISILVNTLITPPPHK